MVDKAAGNGSSSGAQEPEIEIIEEGAQAAQNSSQDGGQQSAGQGYEYPEDDELGQGTGESSGDERVGHNAQGGAVQADDGQGGTPAEKTARQRRRERERAARNAERAELVKLRTQVAELSQRFQQVDSRIANNELTGLDGQIQSLEADIRKADAVMARAMEAQNGGDFVKAQGIRDTLRDQLNGLKAQKASFEAQTEPQQGQAQGGRFIDASGRPLSPQRVRFAQIFVSRHPWYKHGSKDPGSLQVVQLDNEMVAQGLNPETPEYWMELEKRVQEDIPDEFKRVRAPANSDEGGQAQGQRKVNSDNSRNGAGNARPAGGPRLPGSGNASGGGATGGGPIKFHLSAERKQALIDLGVYDDPEKRMKHIKRFIEWDKANPQTDRR